VRDHHVPAVVVEVGARCGGAPGEAVRHDPAGVDLHADRVADEERLVAGLDGDLRRHGGRRGSGLGRLDRRSGRDGGKEAGQQPAGRGEAHSECLS
jgi:hypothetical protein